MNWDQIESNWVQYTGNTNERWDHLAEHQLVDRVQETYGMTYGDDDTHRELSDWQQRLSEIERTAH